MSAVSALRRGAARLGFGVLTLGTAAWCGLQSWGVLAANGVTPLEAVLFALTLVLLTPLSVHLWIAAIGFAAGRLRRRRPAAEDRPPVRAAVVMPVYNEDPHRVFAGLRATYESLERTGHLGAFDFFVLSDTNDPEVWVREEEAFARCRDAVSDPARLHYRNRPVNEGRKAGNVADFCERWGPSYVAMVVLDADSVMAGESLVELVRRVQRDPRTGIVQAPPVPVNRRTLFGRVQQFATAAHGPNAVRGLDVWQAGEGNYWGHNAALRVAAFAEHCGLPVLPGEEPLGGPILSHDFVEAALMIRAGYEVRLAPDVGGSYEETPPSLVEYAARDRRWCQGNLQHLRLLTHPGLRFVSRVHFALGALAYLASPIWLLLLVLATVEALRQGLTPHQYFPPEGTLFPVWREDVLPDAVRLAVSVAALLFVPKLLGLAACLSDRRRRAAFGGGARLVASALLEVLFSILLAPVLAVLQSHFVVSTLLGRKVEWNAQQRGDVGTSWGEAIRRHGGTTLLGVFWTAAILRLLPELLPWLSPVLLGFLLAIPMSVISSRASAGAWFRARGLFCTPEELHPPPVLRRFVELLHGEEPEPACPDALERLLEDAQLRAVHAELTEPGAHDELHAHWLAGLRLKRRLRGPGALDRAERRALLLDPPSVDRLAAELRRPAPDAVPADAC